MTTPLPSAGGAGAGAAGVPGPAAGVVASAAGAGVSAGRRAVLLGRSEAEISPFAADPEARGRRRRLCRSRCVRRRERGTAVPGVSGRSTSHSTGCGAGAGGADRPSPIRRSSRPRTRRGRSCPGSWRRSSPARTPAAVAGSCRGSLDLELGQGRHRHAADAAGIRALREPDVAVGSAGDAGGHGAGVKPVVLPPASSVIPFVAGPQAAEPPGFALAVNHSAPSPPSAIPVGRGPASGRPRTLDLPLVLMRPDRSGIGCLGEVEPAVGAADDACSGAVGGEAARNCWRMVPSPRRCGRCRRGRCPRA